MEIVFFSGVTLSLILFLWQFTYCLGGYNRTLNGIDATMMQNAVVYSLGDSEDNSSTVMMPYFDGTIAKSVVTEYVGETLPKATIGGDYSVDVELSGYRVIIKGSGLYPMKITITLDYDSPAYSASRSKSFRISKGAAYEG